jgi:stress-induced morphogen
MAIKYSQLYALLRAGFENADIDLVDTAGDMNHYEVTIASEKFNGLSLVAQHKMVYDSIGMQMGRELHALKINTKAK